MKVTSIRYLCFVVAVIAMLAVSPVVNGQRGNFDNVEITTTQLDDNLYYLQGEGGQIGVLAGPDGVLMVSMPHGRSVGRLNSSYNLSHSPNGFWSGSARDYRRNLSAESLDDAEKMAQRNPHISSSQSL